MIFHFGISIASLWKVIKRWGELVTGDASHALVVLISFWVVDNTGAMVLASEDDAIRAGRIGVGSGKKPAREIKYSKTGWKYYGASL